VTEPAAVARDKWLFVLRASSDEAKGLAKVPAQPACPRSRPSRESTLCGGIREVLRETALCGGSNNMGIAAPVASPRTRARAAPWAPRDGRGVGASRQGIDAGLSKVDLTGRDAHVVGELLRLWLCGAGAHLSPSLPLSLSPSLPLSLSPSLSGSAPPRLTAANLQSCPSRCSPTRSTTALSTPPPRRIPPPHSPHVRPAPRPMHRAPQPMPRTRTRDRHHTPRRAWRQAATTSQQLPDSLTCFP
jgi:hypothetical protein